MGRAKRFSPTAKANLVSLRVTNVPLRLERAVFGVHPHTRPGLRRETPPNATDAGLSSGRRWRLPTVPASSRSPSYQQSMGQLPKLKDSRSSIRAPLGTSHAALVNPTDTWDGRYDISVTSWSSAAPQPSWNPMSACRSRPPRSACMATAR